MSGTHPQPQGDRLNEASDPGAPARLRRALETAVGAVFQPGNEEITEVLETQFREDTAVSSPVTVLDERIPLHRRLLTVLLRPIRPEM